MSLADWLVLAWRAETVLLTLLGVGGVGLNLWLFSWTHRGMDEVRRFYLVNPPHSIRERQERDSLRNEAREQMSKYTNLLIVQLIFTLYGILTVALPPRPPDLGLLTSVMLLALVLAAELVLDRLAVRQWRYVRRSSRLARLAEE